MKKYHLFKMDLKILNIVSILILLIVLLFTFIFFRSNFISMFSLFNRASFCILLLPTMIFYFMLHEIFHAVGYVIHGADFKKITFGMELEKGVFYCLCKQDIKRNTILLSLIYPLFFIGFVTYIIAIIFNLDILLLLSIINISGAAGDIMYFMFIVKLNKDVLFSEMDDGTSFVLQNIDDVNKYKHFGLEYCGVIDKVKRKDFKKLYVSKLSFVVLIVCIVLLFVGVFK